MRLNGTGGPPRKRRASAAEKGIERRIEPEIPFVKPLQVPVIPQAHIDTANLVITQIGNQPLDITAQKTLYEGNFCNKCFKITNLETVPEIIARRAIKRPSDSIL